MDMKFSAVIAFRSEKNDIGVGGIELVGYRHIGEHSSGGSKEKEIDNSLADVIGELGLKA